MGNVCARPKPEPTPAPVRALTEEETQLINNITKIDNFNEIIGETISNYEDDPIFYTKVFMLLGNNKFSDPTFISEFSKEYTAKITNEVRSGRLSSSTLSSSENIMADIKGVIAPIIKDIILSKSTSNFTRDEAIYFISLGEEVGDVLNNYNIPDNNPNYTSTFVNKLYALSKENPRRSMSDAVSNAVNHLVTTFSLTLNPANTETTTTTESFKDKNSFVMKELEKQLKLSSNTSTEAFRNKKANKRNQYTGYSLEHSALLPKDYADF